MIDNLLQADDTTLILPFDPKLDLSNSKLLQIVDNFPEKMMVLQCYFKITSCIPKAKEKATVWGNIRMSHDSEFDDILSLISHDSQRNEILCMRKRVQCFASVIQDIFISFVNNPTLITSKNKLQVILAILGNYCR